jgi:hypothetical protein
MNDYINFLQDSIDTSVDIFDPNRLKKAINAYPVNDRPRCSSDITCVKYYQKQIQQKKRLVRYGNKYILLDGAHRIVASYILGKKT